MTIANTERLEAVPRVRKDVRRWALLCAVALMLAGVTRAHAQSAQDDDEAPEAPAATGDDAPAAEPAADPAPTSAPPPATDVSPETAAALAPEAPATDEHPDHDTIEPTEATEPEDDASDDGPKLNIGIGMRTGVTGVLNDSGGEAPRITLDDGLVDQFNVRPYFSGQLNKYVGFTANFEIGSHSGLDFQVLDAIVQLWLADEFQIWIGQHIPAMDRSNINGPFFHNSWNFPITVQTFPFDVAARDRGVTFWGLIAEGVLKYHLSVVDAQPEQALETARYSGRLTVHLLEPENFYYNSGTYFGEQDVLAIGAVGHYQKGVEVAGESLDNDFVGWSVDLMFEKNFGDPGTFTIEGAYYNFEGTGADYVPNQGTIDEDIVGVAGPLPGSSYMVAASWLTPGKIGIGKLQPNARVQVGDYGDAKTMTYDVGLAYIIDGFNHRWHLNYRHQDLPDEGGERKIDMLQLGVQIQM